MRPGPAARRSDIEKGRELPVGLFAVKQDDYRVRTTRKRTAFVGSDQKSAEK